MFHDGCAFNDKKIVMECGYTDLPASICTSCLILFTVSSNGMFAE